MTVPNKIDSNVTGLAFAEEAALKLLNGEAGAPAGTPVWYGLEPNSYPEFGASLQTVTRTPINALRQQAKGTITDIDAKAGFNSDLTQRNLTRLLQGFFFADAIEKPATNKFNSAAVVITSVDAAKYNAAAGLDAFKVGHLVFAKNFGVAANNGLKKVSVVAAGALSINGGLSVEANPPAAASIEAVGFEFAAGDLALTVAANVGTLTSATIDMRTLGLTIGEYIFVGGDGAAYRYDNNTSGFYARVKAIAQTTIQFDIASGAVVADAGAAKTIRIFFGKVLQNATTAANIKRRTYNLERQLGNDGDGTQAEYVLGAVPNELTINLPQTAKATADLSFVGMDVTYKTGAEGVKAGTRVAAPFEDAFNTSDDLYAVRLAVIDTTTLAPTALYGYASDMKLSIKNGVQGNKALATVGSFDCSAGDFEVSGSLTAYFASVAAVKAIRANSDVCLTAILAKKNAGIVIDVPLLMLGNGTNKIEKDKPITAELSTNAAKNVNGYTLCMTFFEYLPTLAI